MRKIICTILIFFGFQVCKSQQIQSKHRPTESISLPYFGEILIKPAKDYNTKIKSNSYFISSDLNFYEDVVDKSTLLVVESMLKDLSTFITKSNEILIADFQKSGTVKDYVRHHLEVIEKTELKQLLENSDKNEPIESQMLSLMRVVRIGFYPDEDNHYAVFDFSIGIDKTDYRITIRYNSSGEFNSIEFVS